MGLIFDPLWTFGYPLGPIWVKALVRNFWCANGVFETILFSDFALFGVFSVLSLHLAFNFGS